MHIKRILPTLALICLILAAGPIWGSPTGLNNIPTADVVPKGLLVFQYYSFIAANGRADHFGAFKYGLSSNIEVGLDGRGASDSGADEFLVAQAKLRLDLSDSLALSISPESMPLAVCSSSGVMGYSLSLGKCDLACVVSPDASLADAAATHAANLVKTPEDIEPTLDHITGIEGVSGVLLVQGDRIGIAGDLPPIVRNRDADLGRKVTRDTNG